MEKDFFDQLDEALTSVGADRYWEREIGGHKVWLSPIPFDAQHKINDQMTNSDLGANVVAEVKRMTMSYAIVGFDGYDLRSYRNESPVFPMFDHREKKQVKVALHKYLSNKMSGWGTEWIDSAFEVFADLMETEKRDNLKNIKFENAKDKKEELAELEDKVKQIREELGLPVLVELVPESDQAGLKPVSAPPIPETQPEVPQFNPFQKIPVPVAAPVQVPMPVQMPVAAPVQMPVAAPVQMPVAAPVQAPISIPIDLDSYIPTSTKENPHIIGNGSDIIERGLQKADSPIEIDSAKPQSVNPRFIPRR